MGENLFWRDFNNMAEKYPEFIEILLNEQKNSDFNPDLVF